MWAIPPWCCLIMSDMNFPPLYFFPMDSPCHGQLRRLYTIHYALTNMRNALLIFTMTSLHRSHISDHQQFLVEHWFSADCDATQNGSWKTLCWWNTTVSLLHPAVDETNSLNCQIIKKKAELKSQPHPLSCCVSYLKPPVRMNGVISAPRGEEHTCSSVVSALPLSAHLRKMLISGLFWLKAGRVSYRNGAPV